VEVGRWFDIAVPVGAQSIIGGRDTILDQRSAPWLNVMIRLKPQQSIEAATNALRTVQPDIRAAAMPHDVSAPRQTLFMTVPVSLTQSVNGLSSIRRRYERPLLTVLTDVDAYASRKHSILGRIDSLMLMRVNSMCVLPPWHGEILAAHPAGNT
jgi:hypothetical protein